MKLKINVLLILLLTGTFYSFAQNNMGIGTNTPDPSALVDMQATDKGMLVPRMTTAQRTAIVSPANALLVYDTDAQCFYYFKTATGWTDLCTGIVGPAGPAGPQGAMGLTGPAGANGLDGAVGPAGPQGPAGADGAPGAAGPAGPQGPAGADGAPGVAGPAGPQGPAGADGAPGVAGPAGPQGPQGASVLGATGPQGPAGPAGADGAVGVAGPAGATGPQGTAGADGAPGVAGPCWTARTARPAGATGPQGPQGTAGADGAPGVAGPAGPQGPAGPNNVKKYTVLGTTNATAPANAAAGPFVDMPEMTITFTPINNSVIMLFTAAGTYTTTAYANHSVWFEVLVNGVSIREWDTQCGTGWNLWDIGVSTPLNVNVGVPNTIKIRWAAQRAGTVNTTINNLVLSGTYFNRSMQIIDAP